MKHEPIKVPNPARDATLRSVRDGLASLACGLDARFLDAATTLAAAVETIQNLLASLGDVLTAVDARAGDAVDTLRESTAQFHALPALQAERANDVAKVRRASAELYARITQIQELMRALRVQGTSLRIATSGSPEFADFIEDMLMRLDVGEAHLDTFIAPLRDLATGVATVQRATRLLTGECTRLIPLVPDRLTEDAQALRAYQSTIAETVATVAAIASDLRGRVALVLGALQIGDITRQRLEHMVSALHLMLAYRPISDDRATEPIGAHLLQLVAAQLAALGEDFVRETSLLLSELRALGPETRRLLPLMSAGAQEDEGRGVLEAIERGIAALDGLTTQLSVANGRALTMSAGIADTTDRLGERLDTVRAVRLEVSQLAVNLRMRANYADFDDGSVSATVDEIVIRADRLSAAVEDVAGGIGDLREVSRMIRCRRAYEAQLDLGLRPGRTLAHIREGCRRTKQAIDQGLLESQQLIETLEEAGDRLGRELELGGEIARFAHHLRVIAGATPEIPPDAEAPLRALLVQIGDLYSMASEREIHRDFLLPGMDWPMNPPAAGKGEASDDGLF